MYVLKFVTIIQVKFMSKNFFEKRAGCNLLQRDSLIIYFFRVYCIIKAGKLESRLGILARRLRRDYV